MLNLRKLSSREEASSPTASPVKLRKSNDSSPSTSQTPRISIRDKLLAQEIQELQGEIPPTCRIDFPNPAHICQMTLTVAPDDGFWARGSFKFFIDIPLEYNNCPPRVTCQTKIWHPNVTESGAVCLSLLRSTSLDGTGWLPTRRLKDVIWGMNSLFSDLVDFDDPLNLEAAEQYRKSPVDFAAKAQYYVKKYC